MGRTACITTASLFLAGLILVLGFGPGLAAEKTKVKFAESWLLDAGATEWFVAIDKGYYAEQGLEVQVSRGFGAGADQIKRLLAGEQHLASVDPMAVVLARSKGIKIKLVAMKYEKHPMVIFALKKTGIKAPRDLEGHSVGMSPYGSEKFLLPMLAELNGVDVRKINIVNMNPGQKFSMLGAGKVDSVVLFSSSQPMVSRATAPIGGFNVIAFADYGLDLYGNGIGATDNYISKNPEVIRRFWRASVKGLKFARQHPDQAIDILLKHLPALNRKTNREKWGMAIQLIFTKAAQKYGLGFMTKEKMSKTRDMAARMHKIDNPPALEDIFTNEFVK